MHIVHVITKGDVGGAQSHVLHLATAQLADGDRVTVITGIEGEVTHRLADLGASIVLERALTKAVNPIRDVTLLRALKRRLESLAPDLVHAHSSKAGLATRVVARRMRLPAVYTAHGWPFQNAAPLGQRVASRVGETFAGRLWGHVICVTEAEAELARRGHVVPEARLHVVPLGIPDLPEFTPRRAMTGVNGDDEAIIVMVARFAEPKDQEGLLRAVAPLRLLPWRVMLVGGGRRLEACRVLADDLGLLDRVDFLGDRSDVDKLLQRADISVLWSRYEGMPMVLIESMRAGVACVSSDLPGARAIFGLPTAGLLADSPDALTTALATLLTDVGERMRIGAAGRQRYLAALTATSMHVRVREVYATAIAQIAEGWAQRL